MGFATSDCQFPEVVQPACNLHPYVGSSFLTLIKSPTVGDCCFIVESAAGQCVNCKVRPLRLGVVCRLVDALLDMHVWCELHLIKATATEALQLAVDWHSLVEM